ENINMGEGIDRDNNFSGSGSEPRNADAAANGSKDPVKNFEEELSKKNKEVESLTDMLKRRQADFENYKKRVLREQDDQKKFAIKDFALDIININDDLLRAIDAASSSTDEHTKSLITGVGIVSKRIVETLQKYGIEEIDSLNKEFDPRFNEAVEITKSDDVDTDVITAVYQKGFRLDDYVIRCARVRVTKPDRGNGGESNGIEADGDDCSEEEKTIPTN
ncbi:MAG: nucleotide exchange factor GrpE, partial [Spirochaetes bacterium]|nr:nucleotide exchange factor GrpE [Spirochaetota bacterium]